MKSCKCWLIFFGVIFLQNCFAAPALSNPASDNEDLTNSIEEESDEGEEEEEEDDSLVLDEDDFTTHGLERLSSAATCLVAGVEYTHGQQIYRKDQCEFCLCLDGEMFCWWQDCPPAMDGPCKDRGPFSPCMSIPANPQYLSSSTTSEITTGTNVIRASNSFNKITTKASSSTKSSIATSAKSAESFSSTEKTSTDISSRPPESSTSAIKQNCVIMGREYQIGDKLPHDTGNCLECICGQGAKVTCSPHQCAPVEDDMNDYHMSGARQPVPDIF